MPYLNFELANKVENFIRYRPNFPFKLIDYLYKECGFSKESVIANIGSGIGTFARLLLERGSRVVAIEPDNLLRMTAERLLCDEFHRFVSINGTFENTTLCDSAVNHIVCAPSNTFDFQKCRNEFSRILKPNGTVALVFRKRFCECDEFTFEYEKLIRQYFLNTGKQKYNEFSSIDIVSLLGTDSYSFVSFPSYQNFDLNGIKGECLYNDYFGSVEKERYIQLVEEVCSLFEKYNECGKVTIHYKTEVYCVQLINMAYNTGKEAS